jgi:hypothetical protein
MNQHRDRPSSSFIKLEMSRSAAPPRQSLDGKLKPGHDWRMEVTEEFANPIYVIQVSAKLGS